jgi:hypothetical protein
MKKTEKSFDYLMFAGKTKDDLYPISSWQNKEDAIEAAKRLLATKVYKCIEVTFMPEDDDDTNEVVWSNCGRK